ncbi:MAG TPA: ABC transporter ATP-binding protein [Gammaproteobacteria bacterium]|nr:ABC transporter ATP-binding protein [Gammaproteobacteria bacterium]
MNASGAASGALQVEGLGKRFRSGGREVVALDDVGFQLQEGRVTGLIGADGAGKTTLMRLAAALLLPDSGRLSVLGHDTRREPLAVQSAVGYMPQHFGLYEDLTVQENLDLYAGLQGVPVAARPARYAELMRMTGLSPFTGRLAGKLSGGMKQKLGLACALLRAPRLLLLDEPTVGVDPVSRRELWQIVYRQVEQEGMTVLLSTAYLDEAERCHDILLLHEGRLLGQGAPQAFSREMEGRSFLVRARQMNRRTLQARLATLEGVLDTVIIGDDVRVVTAGPEATLPRELDGEALEVRAVAPRFEDAFVARLAARRGGASAVVTAFERREAGGDGGPVIEVHKVRRMFGDFCAVRDVSFEVRRGEIFGLLGANGAGKTTLFRMLCGLLPVSAGEARVAGVDLRTARAQARARIGYMAQKFSLYVDLSVGQNLEFFANAYSLPRKARRERVAWAMENFELAGVTDTQARDLPLGFQQRLALAAALMHRPEILFLDEPTSGVDPIARREFWRRINALAESGVTVLVTTHFMEEAEYCDRLVIMAAGEILAQGTPAGIKADQRSEALPQPTMEDAFIALIERHAQLPEQAA